MAPYSASSCRFLRENLSIGPAAGVLSAWQAACTPRRTRPEQHRFEDHRFTRASQIQRACRSCGESLHPALAHAHEPAALPTTLSLRAIRLQVCRRAGKAVGRRPSPQPRLDSRAANRLCVWATASIWGAATRSEQRAGLGALAALGGCRRAAGAPGRVRAVAGRKAGHREGGVRLPGAHGGNYRNLRGGLRSSRAR